MKKIGKIRTGGMERRWRKGKKRKSKKQKNRSPPGEPPGNPQPPAAAPGASGPERERPGSAGNAPGAPRGNAGSPPETPDALRAGNPPGTPAGAPRERRERHGSLFLFRSRQVHLHGILPPLAAFSRSTGPENRAGDLRLAWFTVFLVGLAGDPPLPLHASNLARV